MSESDIKTEVKYPYAEITRMGRFKYEIYIRYCFPKYHGWSTGIAYRRWFGKRWAERFAKREMARYLQREEWRKQMWVVRPDSQTVS